MKGYSDEELAWLEANYKMVMGEYVKAFEERFGREVKPRNLHALRKRRGWKTGRTGQFTKGIVPHNKGKPFPSRGRSASTQFKKGNLTGRANLNYQPIGSERISKDGYRERKIHDDLPRQSRWQPIHRIEWEAVNGPIPEGMYLKCLDGDRTNTDPANWKLLPRGTLPYLNGHRGFDYDKAEPEVRPAILAIAKVRHANAQVKKRRRAA